MVQGGRWVCSPEVFPLRPDTGDFLPRELLLELGGGSADFAEDILIVLCFNGGERLAD